MTYIYLIIILSILLLYVYINEKDIFSPIFLSLLALLGAFTLAFIGTFTWNTQKEMSMQLVLIFLIGILSFTIGAQIAQKMSIKKKLNKNIKNKEIKIDKWKVIMSSIFIISTIVLMILEIKRICSYFGYSSNNISKLLSYYRSKSILYSNEISTKTADINFIIKQMHKTSVVIGVLFIYAFCNNFFMNKKNYYLVLPIVLSMIESLLTSGRSLFMKLIIIFLLCFLYFKIKKDKQINKKTIIYGAISIISILLIFYIMLPLLGRSTNISFIKYITFYFSCGIPSFDLFLTKIPEHAGYIGEETFTGLYLLLNKFHIVSFTRVSSYGWETIGGMHSNIYTSLKAYYYDFGYIGVCILQLLFGFLSTIYYNFSKSNKNIIFLVIYFYYIYIFIEQIRAEQFYYLISSTTISILLIIIVMYYLLYKFNKKNNKELINKIRGIVKK
ncbi:MAG: oligosaccharide repeat unit polymerase [Bacilli bacterium]|nr:oligosaccharide repeat unit polymerase [Bacilli bacterium]MBQ3475851.1 oligosaccharide repeat unit polymerase [Bacilli bacterium]